MIRKGGMRVQVGGIGIPSYLTTPRLVATVLLHAAAKCQCQFLMPPMPSHPTLDFKVWTLFRNTSEKRDREKTEK